MDQGFTGRKGDEAPTRFGHTVGVEPQHTDVIGVGDGCDGHALCTRTLQQGIDSSLRHYGAQTAHAIDMEETGRSPLVVTTRLRISDTIGDALDDPWKAEQPMGCNTSHFGIKKQITLQPSIFFGHASLG
jgi:hypothetical protein